MQGRPPSLPPPAAAVPGRELHRRPRQLWHSALRRRCRWCCSARTLPPTSNRDEDSDLGGCTSRCCSTVSVSRPRLPRGPQQQQLTSHSTLFYSADLLFTTLPANSSLHYSSLISFRPVHFLPDTARGTTIARESLNLLRDFHQRLANLHFPCG